MRRALDETGRRRARQLEFNEAHGITPQSIRKSVRDYMEAHGVHAEAPASGEEAQRLSPAQAVKKIRRLEQEMHRLARNLEFEEAARVRDQIAALRRSSLGAESERLAG